MRTAVEVAFLAWLLVALATVHELRRNQELEMRRYVQAVCSDGIPPPDFHGEHLDRVLQGVLGPELLEGCAVVRRRFEVELSEGAVNQGMHWKSEQKEASWR